MGHGYGDVAIPPACGVPPATRRGLDSAVETATAALRGAADYWAGAIADDLGEVAAAVDHIGEPVNLVGDCQGGWLATIYAALHPENVNTLTIAGAPIDFHAGDAVIHDSVQVLSDDDLRFYKQMVRL